MMRYARDFLLSLAMLLGLYVVGGWPAALIGASWSCITYCEGLVKGRQQLQAQFDRLSGTTRELLDAMPSQQINAGGNDFVAMVHRFRVARINAAIAAGRCKGGST
ncbi:hypothetical protein LNV47_22545 [Paucibacter sp. DJ4R-1]|nr:hypothetical protein [Paucibacter sp. DJ4R-1]